jgi:copper(I)-binding protein
VKNSPLVSLDVEARAIVPKRYSMKKLLIFILLFTAQAVTLAVAEQAADLSVTNAYIRTMPPGQTKTAGFLSVTNNGALSCQLTSAKSSLSSRIEFHEHQHSQGMMRMRPVAAVVVPPGETVVFAPGALHIMLFNIDDALEAGDITQMQLATDQCGSISFDAEVRSLVKKSKPMDAMHH